MGLEFHTPKTLCEKWPQGCQFCDLILCDGKKESATIKITQRDFHICAHVCEESVCLRHHEKYGNCNMYSAKSKHTNADRIRAMTDEDLAEFLLGCCPPEDPDCDKYSIEGGGGRRDCYRCRLDWLKQEAT